MQQFFYPLIVDINKKTLNYLSYLREKDDNSMVKKSPEISIELFNNSENSFYSKLMKMSEYFNLFDFNYNHWATARLIKQLVDLVKKNCPLLEPDASAHTFHDSIKKNYHMRRTLVKLRIGCHNLRVKTGRYDKISLDKSICPLCSGNKIEDKIHLLLSRLSEIFLDERHIIFQTWNKSWWYSKIIAWKLDITTDEFYWLLC